MFTALGIWQVKRLAWKQDLIARVEARVSADPVALDILQGLPASDREYRPVTVSGRFLPGAEVLVKAVTVHGGGYWVLSPLIGKDGQSILINRGFIPPEMRAPQSRPAPAMDEEVTITGLARLSEPGGGFLRRNDPGAERWYSRDIAAIASHLGLQNVADIFVDAAASEGYPIGGLTIIRFRNTHLAYALTWFALAALVAIGMGILIRYEYRMRQG